LYSWQGKTQTLSGAEWGVDMVLICQDQFLVQSNFDFRDSIFPF
jgi:hypothetical protein